MIRLLGISIFLFCVLIPFANAQVDPGNRGEVLMLEEIIIQVAPELPTVVVTIPRQQPALKKITIQSPLSRMIESKTKSIKPDLSKTKVSKVKDSEKMLATVRKR